MEGKKFIKIINDLTGQGYKLKNINSFIKANQKNYSEDKEIYKGLCAFFMGEHELNDENLKKINFEALDNTIIIAEALNEYSTADVVLNCRKDNPVYTKYIENIEFKKAH